MKSFPTAWMVRLVVGGVVLAGLATGCRGLFARRSGTAGLPAFRNSGSTLSFFTAVQVDPRAEDSAGPQVVTAGDLDGDGLLDLASGWNESQPVQIHLQRRDANNRIRFETVTLAGNVPIASVADMAIADADSDGHNDLIVLVKDTGGNGLCRATGETVLGQTGVVVIYFGPADPAQVGNPLAWQDVELSNSQVQGSEASSGGSAQTAAPEEGGYTALAVGDVDGVNGPDLVVTFNGGGCDGDVRQVDLYYNPGAAAARASGAWTPTFLFQGTPGDANVVAIKDVVLADLDRDGDLDVVTTFPGANSRNVSWFRNPQLDAPDEFHVSDGQWHMGVIGQIATGADVLAVGDIDRDGIVDVAVRSTTGRVVQWLKGPQFASSEPVRNIPWRVYALAEFRQREPQALALGDFDGDGAIDAVASAEGAIVWFDARSGSAVYNQWSENLIIDENPGTGSAGGSSASDSSGTASSQPANVPPATDPNVNAEDLATTATFINSLLAVDLDGDGDLDLVATLDRRGLSGLTNDALIWYRNDRSALAAP